MAANVTFVGPGSTCRIAAEDVVRLAQSVRGLHLPERPRMREFADKLEAGGTFILSDLTQDQRDALRFAVASIEIAVGVLSEPLLCLDAELDPEKFEDRS
jgi:hypothetical protein